MKIKRIASAFPETIYDAEAIAQWTGADPEFVKKRIGVSARAFLGPEETGVGLAKKAVDRLLNVNVSSDGIDEIDLIVYVTQTPDHGIPHNSALLHALLEAPKSMACFDVGLGCSGYPYALAIAKGLMSTQGLKKAIVVTCDPYSKIMRKEDKGTVAVFGDAATATLLSDDGCADIGLVDFGTDGSGKDALIVLAGRAASPIWSIHNDTPGLQADNPDDYRLHMNGRNVFNFVMSVVPESLRRAAEKNAVDIADIDLFALHQGSRYMLDALASRVGIPQEKLLVNMDKYGNTVSSTIPLLLQDVMDDYPSFSGSVMISGFGVGLSWSSTLLTFS